MNFKTGDEITIARGTYRNQVATVLEVSEVKETYAVKLPDGTLTVVNAKNVRVPAEASISASDLGSVLSNHEISDALLADLEARVPGITSHVILVSA